MTIQIICRSFLTVTLTSDDLATLVNALHEVRDKWYHLGVQLNMKTSDLNAIRSQYMNKPDDCLQEMLSVWLSRTDPFPPSWQRVVDALSYPAVDRQNLARHIRQTYLCQETTNDSVVKKPDIKEVESTMEGLESEFEALKVDVNESVKPQPVDVLKVKQTAVDRTDVAERIKKSHCNGNEGKHSSTEISTIGKPDSYLSVEEVRSEIESLEKVFMELKDDVCESVMTQPVDTFKFRLTSLKVGEVEHHMDYLNEIIENKHTVVDILMKHNYYLNFLNHGLLQHILDKFKNKELQKRMDEYKVKLSKFFKCTYLRDFILCWQQHRCQPPVEDLQKFIELKARKKWETCTLEDLENLKDRLATKLFFPKFGLVLEKANEGCLAVTYTIPSSIVSQVQTAIKEIELCVFVDMEIETITVDGVVCYEAPLLQYTTALKQLYTSGNLLQPLSDSKQKPLLPFRLARIDKKPSQHQT